MVVGRARKQWSEDTHQAARCRAYTTYLTFFVSPFLISVIFRMVSSAQVNWLHPRGVIGRVNCGRVLIEMR